MKSIFGEEETWEGGGKMERMEEMGGGFLLPGCPSPTDSEVKRKVSPSVEVPAT